MTDKQKQALKAASDKIKELEARIKEFKTSEEFLGFIKAMSRFHKYSFNNQMLILAQMPTATRVAGFRTWRTMGRFVKKGEKGLVIMVPLKRGVPKETDDPDAEPELIPILTGFTTGHVFDISQTDGKPLPEIDMSMKNHGPAFMAQCRMLAEKRGVTVMTRERMHADGISRGGKVVLRKDENPTYMAATLLHELAHETLHHDTEGKQLTREQRELEAETVAYLVCDRFGIELPAHKYLVSWKKSESIMASLKRISECSSEMIEELSDISKDVRMADMAVPETETAQETVGNFAFI